MSWEAIGDALQRAIALGAQLPEESVTWGFQDIDEPALPFIELAVSPARVIGRDYLVKSFDDTRPQGQEVKVEVRGMRAITIEIHGYTLQAWGMGRQTAVGLVDAAATALTLPSIRTLLQRVDCGVFRIGEAEDMPVVVGSAFRGRALCLVEAYIPPQAIAEYCGYIAKVSGSVTTIGGRVTPKVEDFEAP